MTSIRRQVKNVVRNYTDAERKVRESTSNDPWGPSSSIMSEIADATYNVVAFSEIMTMLWKRLNDHGRNWRHVYKALTVMEYIIKTGSERVAQQCRENIFAIQTLKDFQYIDKDGKDQGMNVREKSKQLVSLLKDEDRLKSERARALKAKERFAQASGTGMSSSQGTGTTPTPTEVVESSSPNSLATAEAVGGPTPTKPANEDGEWPTHVDVTTLKIPSSDLEIHRPLTVGEEELQLQLALAMSKEEHDRESQLRKGDDVRLQMAINESQENNERPPMLKQAQVLESGPPVDPWSSHPPPPPAAAPVTDPWGFTPVNQTQSVQPVPQPAQVDAWGAASKPTPPLPHRPHDPWSSPTAAAQPPALVDPWGGGGGGPASRPPNPWAPPEDEFAALRSNDSGAHQPPPPAMMMMTPPPRPLPPTNNPFNLAAAMDNSLIGQQGLIDSQPKKTPETFLGENAKLVNLDSLVTAPKPQAYGSNPFVSSSSPEVHPPEPVPAASNPFQVNRAPPPSINELRNMNTQMFQQPVASDNLPPPLLPAGQGQQQPQPCSNPFAGF